MFNEGPLLLKSSLVCLLEGRGFPKGKVWVRPFKSNQKSHDWPFEASRGMADTGVYTLDRELGHVAWVLSWRRAPLSQEQLAAVAGTAGFSNEDVLCWLLFSPAPRTAALSTLKAVCCP